MVIESELTARIWPLLTPRCAAPPPFAPDPPAPPRNTAVPVGPVGPAGVAAGARVEPNAKPPPNSARATTTPTTIWTGRRARTFIAISPLLVAQCLDRMQTRRPHRRVETEDHSDRDGHTDGDRDRARRDEDRDLCRGRDLMDHYGDAPAEQDPEDAADAGEADRLDEELGEDVAPARADGLADADLPGPLVHRDEHDVHDPDASDEQRDPADRPEEQRERPGHRAERVQRVVLVRDREVGVRRIADVVTLQEDVLHVARGDV